GGLPSGKKETPRGGRGALRSKEWRLPLYLVERRLPQLGDFVLKLQFPPFQLAQFQRVRTRMRLGVLNLSFQVAMTALELGDLRFGGHQKASVSTFDDDSVTPRLWHRRPVLSTKRGDFRGIWGFKWVSENLRSTIPAPVLGAV